MARTVEMRRRSSQERALDFLRDAHLYRLGILPTEQPHPATRDLSRWAQLDLPRAVEALKRVDLRALGSLQRYAGAVDRLSRAVAATLERGRRVFLCGCGATGRLSLSLEFLWRMKHPGNDQVRSFMAGGDVALVHALEGFEDHPAYGARHLEEMGFSDGDLLIACTEGGETPYVIGATERAARISSNRPYFLYCNPDAVLARHVRRFRRVYESHDIKKVCLYVGPMALAGSTRMQASTVLQAAVGSALLHPGEPAGDLFAGFGERVRATRLDFLAAFVERESAIYSAGDHVTYSVREFGITVLTDTTERAPTFNLIPFDQLGERRPGHSPCYVSLETAANPRDAWSQLLGRAPRPLGWPEVDARTTAEYLHGFDFSVHAPARRRLQIPDRAHHGFGVWGSRAGIELDLAGLAHTVATDGMPELFRHLLLKQILNIHSTLVMGRLGRYVGNLMTWVTPTNGKLIDRAARHVMHLLARAGRVDLGYENIVHRLFVEMDRVGANEPVVLRTYRSLLRRSGAA